MATSIFKPVTVITGASVGIGAALARVFARNGHEVALVARREKEMVLLATELAVSAKYKPHVITADLQRSDAPARIAHELLGRGLEPAIVVNNAGFGLHGPAAEVDRGEQLAMIDLNVRALTDLSVLCPGPVKTEFQLRAGLDSRSPPPLLGRTPEQVAQAGYDGFMAGKRIVIPGFANKLVSMLPRFLPRSLMLKSIDSYQRDRGRRAENRQRKPR